MSEMQNDMEGAQIDDALSVEEQARAVGWKGKDEMADPDKWVDAETFLKARDDNLAIAKHDTKRLTRENVSLSKKLANAQKMIDQLSQFEQRAYERAMADIKAKQEQAVLDGDTAAFKKLDQEADKLRADAAKDGPKREDGGDFQDAFADWLIDNDWYEKDRTRQVYADTVVKKLGPPNEYDGTAEEYLAEVARQVEERFARKKAPDKINPVAGATSGRQPGGKGRTYSDLPSDAKQMADQMVRMGIFKDKDAYAKEYWNNA